MVPDTAFDQPTWHLAPGVVATFKARRARAIPLPLCLRRIWLTRCAQASQA